MEVSLQVFLSFYQLKASALPYGTLSLNGVRRGVCLLLIPNRIKTIGKSFSGLLLSMSTLWRMGGYTLAGCRGFPSTGAMTHLGFMGWTRRS
uniref:Uncharacterized protein n=1 Tax=Cajanus cajan TaxID=3821 RepID=A0A151TTV2_CAJCA|nr:hypothetical protein KK1_009707 [Cajanus cajan]